MNRAGLAAVAVGLIVSVYVPLLDAPFDFIDDGNLVYPTEAISGAQRVALAWQKVVANYEHLGPFRPVLWAHWEVQADLLGASPRCWRLWRLAWLTLATVTMFWLLHELHIPPLAASVAVAISMWNPYRGEIWRSLTLSEGVAMPYAITALACALRAGRSSTPGRWDVAGALALLMALGCKNTFAAIVPAQILLRIAPNGEPLAPAWHRHGGRAIVLALPLLLPLGHFLIFASTWHAGQYAVHAPGLTELRRMLDAVRRAMSLEIIGVALIVAFAAVYQVVVSMRRTATASWLTRVRYTITAIWTRHRAAMRAGLALGVAGVAIYLPLGAICGHYTIPAAWGGDLWVAALLSALGAVPASAWKHAAYALIGCALIAIVIQSLAKQAEFATRAAMLWDALGWIETQTPPGASVDWVAGPALDAAEGIHTAWHLRGRRSDRRVRLLDGRGSLLRRPELAPVDVPGVLIVTDGSVPPLSGPFAPPQRFTRTYWFGTRRHTCAVWQRGANSRDAEHTPP